MAEWHQTVNLAHQKLSRFKSYFAHQKGFVMKDRASDLTNSLHGQLLEIELKDETD